jgi:hypothetical protein
VFPVRYKLNFKISFIRDSIFKGLIMMPMWNSVSVDCIFSPEETKAEWEFSTYTYWLVYLLCEYSYSEPH